jgi:hypothetical protein
MISASSKMIILTMKVGYLNNKHGDMNGDFTSHLEILGMKHPNQDIALVN